MWNKTYINWMTCKWKTSQYWEFFNISISLEKLQEYVNDKWYVNVVMSKRKEEGQYWETHYFTLNEWKKEETKKEEEMIDVEDLPF